MHLLNASTLKLQHFIKEIPPYAILSHTWGDEEVTFDDIEEPYATSMKGYRKIVGCCAQARLDGFDWVWIDTCCIDKKSSAELSEAINSMYRWYWRAETCYVHLSDVPAKPLRKSAWFTRGWTLQELLAPVMVEFYARDWTWIGTKMSLAKDIRRTTGISYDVLLDRTNVKLACVAEKFSWASQREVTRAEDTAYSLLGIFEVNMPLLYGEGPRAFYRLQEEILRQTPDQTIFAWDCTMYRTDPNCEELSYQPTNARCFSRGSEDWGMLAPNPRCFSFYHVHVVHPSKYHSRPERGQAHELTNMGLWISLPLQKHSRDEVLAVLNCQRSESRGVAVWLRREENAHYTRIPDRPPEDFKIEMASQLPRQHIFVKAQTPEPTETWDEISQIPILLCVGNLEVWDVARLKKANVRLISFPIAPKDDTVRSYRDQPWTGHKDPKQGCITSKETCTAVLLSLHGRTIATLFNHDPPFTYLRLLPLDTIEDVSKVILTCHQDRALAKRLRTEHDDDLYFLRDNLEEQCYDMTVVVSARRARRQDCSAWELSIWAWRTVDGKPDQTYNTARTHFQL
jgi:hypothetical protein